MSRRKSVSALIYASAWLPLCALSLLWSGRLTASAQSAPRYRDARTGIEIRFDADKGIFTQEDLSPPMSARARSLKAEQVDRAVRVICAGLAKYPPALVRKYLKVIYVVRDLSAHKALTPGHDNTDTKRIYVSYQGGRNDYEPAFLDTYMEGILHLYLAHLLIVNNLAKLPDSLWKQWERCNAPGFRYGKGNGGATREEQDATDNSVWWKQGFTDEFALSDIDADVASTGELLFAGDARFWQNLDQYAILKKKVDILIAFYHSLDSAFTADYFRRLADAVPPSVTEASLVSVPVSCYAPGDLIVFTHGGKIILPDAARHVVNVAAGALGFYPKNGYCLLQTGAGRPEQAAAPATPVPDAPRPPPGCSLLWTPSTGWLLYASERGMRADNGILRLNYQASDRLYFPFGGQFYIPGSAAVIQIMPGRIETLPMQAIAVFNPPSPAAAAHQTNEPKEAVYP